jgi:hypothetical protein
MASSFSGPGHSCRYGKIASCASLAPATCRVIYRQMFR